MQKLEYDPSSFRKMFVSFELSIKSLFFGRKWIIYLLLAFFPLFFTLLSEDRLLGNSSVEDAFVSLFLETLLFFFFTFGCLIISMPFSADEITDHLLDLYIVRPIPRSILFISRWIAFHLAVLIVNMIIATLYFFYLHIIADDVSINILIKNLHLLAKSYLIIGYGVLAYGGLFLIIGFIGNRAFTVGVIVALFERFFLSILFLSDQPYLPITNLQTIASELFSPLFTYNPSTEVPDFILSQLYIVLLAVVFLGLGLFFIRRKEFE